MNGSNDPSSFWEKYYIEPLAKSAAEIVARTGVWFDSPHSQNFLIEFDRDMKPTGKIILRDLGDVYINKQIVEALGEGKILEKFSAKENILTYLSIGFGPLHGNTRPSWIHKAQYDAWGEKFNEVFSREFYKRTKIQKANYTPSSGFSYFDVAVDGQSKDFKIYQQSIKPVPKWCTKIF